MNWSTINWGSVADWVSGLGSMFAAVVALYLARWNERIHLKGSVSVRLIIGGGAPRSEVIFISVTNVGTRATIINNIGMCVGKRRSRRLAVIAMVKDAYSVGIPFPIADGQEGTWAIPLDRDHSWLRDLGKIVKTNADLASLRFQIHTTHQRVFHIRPEKSFLEAAQKALEARVAEPEDSLSRPE